MFTTKSIVSIVLALFLIQAHMHAQDKKQETAEKECFNDSLKTAIQDKINFYIAEQKKNSEAIEALQKELEQRRALNERLNGAAAAAQEILLELPEKNTGDRQYP